MSGLLLQRRTHLAVSILLLLFCLLTGNGVRLYAQQLTSSELRESLLKLQEKDSDTGYINQLLKVSKHYIFKFGETPSDLDSALLLIQKAAMLSRKISYQRGYGEALYQNGMAYRERGERDKGKSFAEQAVTLAEQNKLYDLLGQSYLDLNQFYDHWNDQEFPVKIQITQKAVDAFLLAGDKENQAAALQYMGDLYHLHTETIPEAIYTLRQALNVYQQTGYRKLQGIYDLLGECYRQIADPASALRYGLLAEQTALEVNDTTLQLCTIYNRLGTTYENLKEPLKANEYFKKGLLIAERYEDISGIYESAANSCAVMITSNPSEAIKSLQGILKKYTFPDDIMPYFNVLFLRAYTNLGNFTNAGDYFEKLFNKYDKANAENYDIGAINHGILFLIKIKQYAEAAQYLANIDRLPRSSIGLRDWSNTRMLWFRLDSSRGNFSSALKYYQQYRNVLDSVYNINKLKQADVTQVEFETQQKQKDIDRLKFENQLQSDKIRRSLFIRNSTIGGIILLAIFFALLYKQNKVNKESNRQLVSKQSEVNEKNKILQQMVEEKEWLLKEIHHRVKNNLQTVVSLLESQSAYLQSDALAAIQDSQNRVHAMSLVHQKLYLTDNVASIDMATYLKQLVSYLRTSFNAVGIQFQVEVSAIELDVSQAIPVGLIVNEAITNSIKYAFIPGQQNKTIIVSMMYVEKQMNLVIADNGTGFSVESKNAEGLGLRLMKGLTEDIQGALTIGSENGTSISVSFTANIPFYKKALNTFLVS